MTLVSLAKDATKAVVAPELLVADKLLNKGSPKPPRRKIHLHVPVWLLVAILIAAVVGVGKLTGISINLPTLWGSTVTEPAQLDPVMVQPKDFIGLDYATSNNYDIPWKSEKYWFTIAGAIQPWSDAYREIEAKTSVPLYDSQQVAPSDITVTIDQATNEKPGVIHYNVVLTPPVFGHATFLMKTVTQEDGQVVRVPDYTIHDYYSWNSVGTHKLTDEEMTAKALTAAEAAAQVDTSAVPAAKTYVETRLTSNVTNWVTPVLQELNAKQHIGVYTIDFKFSWTGTSAITIPPNS